MKEKISLSYRLQSMQVSEKFNLLDEALLNGTLRTIIGKYTIFQLERVVTLIKCNDIIGNRIKLLQEVQKELDIKKAALSKFQNDKEIQTSLMGSTTLSSLDALDEYLRITYDTFNTNVELYEYAFQKGCLVELVQESTDTQLSVIEDIIIKDDIVGVRITILDAVRKEKLNRTSKKVDLKHPKRK